MLKNALASICMASAPGSAREQVYYLRGIMAKVNRPSEPKAGRRVRMVTNLVQPGKLTRDLITISPHPSAEPGVANRGVIGNNVRLRAF